MLRLWGRQRDEELGFIATGAQFCLFHDASRATLRDEAAAAGNKHSEALGNPGDDESSGTGTSTHGLDGNDLTSCSNPDRRRDFGGPSGLVAQRARNCGIAGTDLDRAAPSLAIYSFHIFAGIH